MSVTHWQATAEIDALRAVGFPVPTGATDLTTAAADGCGQRMWLLFRTPSGVVWKPVAGHDLGLLEAAKQLYAVRQRLEHPAARRDPIW